MLPFPLEVGGPEFSFADDNEPSLFLPFDHLSPLGATLPPFKTDKLFTFPKSQRSNP